MLTKICIKCKIEKDIFDFYKTKAYKDGYCARCKDCKIKDDKKYYQKNKEKIKKYNKKYRNEHKEKVKQCEKEYRQNNKEKIKEYRDNYYKEQRKKFPWKSHYKEAKSRCYNPNRPNYKYYGGCGIKFLMTMEDFKFLWFRDKAYNTNQPSIDRKNNDKNYALENCRFVELSENTLKRNKKKY